jgi:DNA repair photolyase
VVLYTNTLEKLRTELARKRKRPQAVYFSPSCDLFQPVPQVLDLGYQVLAYLLGEGMNIALLTKGVIPPEHFALLCRHASRVRVQIGITTLDAATAACFEPHAALPEVRMAQIRRLIAAGIETHARVDPMLPGITDDPVTLDTLFAELARCGVIESAISSLFLRPTILQVLKRELRGTRYYDQLNTRLTACQRLAIHADQSTVSALSQGVRRELYQRVHLIAAAHGIAVHVCACKNPDIARGSCHIAGRWEREQEKRDHPVLFNEMGIGRWQG